MRGQQQLHDPKARFGAHRGKHVGVSCNLFGTFPGLRRLLACFDNCSNIDSGQVIASMEPLMCNQMCEGMFHAV
jgi:hypothetical protein